MRRMRKQTGVVRVHSYIFIYILNVRHSCEYTYTWLGFVRTIERHHKHTDTHTLHTYRQVKSECWIGQFKFITDGFWPKTNEKTPRSNMHSWNVWCWFDLSTQVNKCWMFADKRCYLFWFFFILSPSLFI